MHAQGCYSINKDKLASTIGINHELIPYLLLEIPGCENIILNNNYATFVLNEHNEKLNGGTRTEISINYPFTEGDDVEYRWSIMIPSEAAPGGNTKEWWVIAQWHDQPDPRLGETWANFKGQPPPVAIYIENRDGNVGIGLSGIGGKKISWAPVPSDVWLDLQVKIHWSTTTDGVVSFGIDKHPDSYVVSKGRNMLNGYQHYFKAGQYRAPWVKKYSVINVKNVIFKKL